eukprot:g59494.t1
MPFLTLLSGILHSGEKCTMRQREKHRSIIMSFAACIGLIVFLISLVGFMLTLHGFSRNDTTRPLLQKSRPTIKEQVHPGLVNPDEVHVPISLHFPDLDLNLGWSHNLSPDNLLSHVRASTCNLRQYSYQARPTQNPRFQDLVAFSRCDQQLENKKKNTTEDKKKEQDKAFILDEGDDSSLISLATLLEAASQVKKSEAATIYAVTITAKSIALGNLFSSISTCLFFPNPDALCSKPCRKTRPKDDFNAVLSKILLQNPVEALGGVVCHKPGTGSKALGKYIFLYILLVLAQNPDQRQLNAILSKFLLQNPGRSRGLCL